MKTLIALLVIGSAKVWASDCLLFLEAIAQVESGGDDLAVGPCGSRGRYQLSWSAWAQWSKEPHTEAHNPTKSLAVALKHVAWIRKTVAEREGINLGDVDYREIANCWLRGVNWSRNGENWDRGIQRMEYSARVMNLFHELKTKS